MIKSGLYQPAFYLLKNPYGFFNNSLQPAARINCLLKADNFHTCSLSSIFCQVQKVNCPVRARETTLGCAPAENDFNFVFRLRGKFCEAFSEI